MSETIYQGPGLLTTTFVVFLILKLTGVISWSWWFVTMPIWIIPLFIIAILIVILIIGLIVAIIGGIVSLFE